MNNLSSKNRKYIYLLIIVLLYIPIMLLGMPATNESEGGNLAQLRKKYDLGESAIGNVDPSSSTMNLLLLGMRGIATNQLWLQAEHYKNTKNWAGLKSAVDSIIMLQPHYAKVWEFQGWNLAYNVSAEWDSVEDRYYWVKEGGKFLARGCKRNEKSPDMHWSVGNLHSKKIGRSDEWKFFRKFYIVDPDEDSFSKGPDPEFNPEGKDNYLVAKEWFDLANEKDKIVPQHIMIPVLFRHYPSRALLDYADTLHREGRFGKASRQGWEDGHKELTEVYGRMRIVVPPGEIMLEADSEDIKALAEEFAPPGSNEDELREYGEELARWVLKYQDVANYRYWRARSSIESEQMMMIAHKDVYEGQQLYKKGRLIQARRKLYEGLSKFVPTLNQISQRNPGLNINNLDENLTEEIILAIIYFTSTYELNGQKPPENYPLKEIVKGRPDILGRAITEFHFQNRSNN